MAIANPFSLTFILAIVVSSAHGSSDDEVGERDGVEPTRAMTQAATRGRRRSNGGDMSNVGRSGSDVSDVNRSGSGASNVGRFGGGVSSSSKAINRLRPLNRVDQPINRLTD
ncbi:hypothetical protein GUJ93_ZPchr0004g38469 [Zizania palustris]|uniref:Secreted protein n=1 Tax=Zizania palustris TaxID=103762 RepID=A0A8J5SPZ8_ZIZPA|nr:hypothetical protein GUJ93_ZPchr0004g38469 [Zizania palustris]